MTEEQRKEKIETGGRERGNVHDPTQAQMASDNEGLGPMPEKPSSKTVEPDASNSRPKSA